jgi:hypothetical protein
VAEAFLVSKCKVRIWMYCRVEKDNSSIKREIEELKVVSDEVLRAKVVGASQQLSDWHGDVLCGLYIQYIFVFFIFTFSRNSAVHSLCFHPLFLCVIA